MIFVSSEHFPLQPAAAVRFNVDRSCSTGSETAHCGQIDRRAPQTAEVTMCRRYLAVALMLGGLAAAAAAQPAACPPPTSTFDLIQRGIFERHSCTLSYCHGADKKYGLDLRAATAYDSLLDHDEEADPDEDATGEHFKLVDPGHPEDSELWLSLAAKTLGRTDTSVKPMPLDALPLTSDELEGLRLWILRGARERGFIAGVDDLIDPCAPVSDDSNDANLPLCEPGDRLLQLPDLSADPPEDVQVINRDGHRYLQFTSSVANTGAGPLIVQAATPATHPGQMLEAQQVILRADGSKCVHPAGLIGYQETGQTWAYAHLATYELRKDDPFTGDLVAQVSKTAYCLLDTDPIRAADNRPHQYDAHCTDTVGRMGISVGYKDVYHRYHPGQWIDLDADPETTIDPGQYYLVNIANPASTLWEIDDSREANLGYRQIRVTLKDPDPAGSGAPPVEPTPSVEPTPPQTNSHQPSRPARPQRPTSPAGSVHAPHAPHAPQHPIVARPTRAPRPTATPRAPNTVHQPSAPQAAPTLKPKHPVRAPRPTRRPRPTRPPR
jgi:Lysyl oxidase